VRISRNETIEIADAKQQFRTDS